MLIGWFSWIALACIAGQAGPARARVLVRGAVGASRLPAFVWADRGLSLSLQYRFGRIVLKHWKIVRFKAKKKFRKAVGRFELLGFYHGRAVSSWQMDFPLLGRTHVYSARDRRLMMALQRHVQATATVLLPMRADVDKLMVKDQVTGRRTILFLGKRGPMCRAKGAVHRSRYRKRGGRRSGPAKSRTRQEARKR